MSYSFAVSLLQVVSSAASLAPVNTTRHAKMTSTNKQSHLALYFHFPGTVLDPHACLSVCLYASLFVCLAVTGSGGSGGGATTTLQPGQSNDVKTFTFDAVYDQK